MLLYPRFEDKGPRPLVQCRFLPVQFCASTSVAAAASRDVQLQTWDRKHTPTLVISPYFCPSMSCIVHTQHRKSVGVCVEGEKVFCHDSSVQNFCLLEQRRQHDNKLYWHDPAVVDAHPFKYTENIESVASALNCAETPLC
jgi:hypothetical protein